jgi:hypothetical protein
MQFNAVPLLLFLSPFLVKLAVWWCCHALAMPSGHAAAARSCPGFLLAFCRRAYVLF